MPPFSRLSAFKILHYRMLGRKAGWKGPFGSRLGNRSRNGSGGGSQGLGVGVSGPGIRRESGPVSAGQSERQTGREMRGEWRPDMHFD
jgi:hypothetical protein